MSESIKFKKELGLLLRALKIHGEKIQSDILAVTLTSLIGALCDAGKLTPKHVQVLGVWILEGGFRKDDNTFDNKIHKIYLDPVNRNELPSIAYLRMPVLRAEQVAAQHVQDQVLPLESIERLIPPLRPEDN
jgi:hypothetical protein